MLKLQEKCIIMAESLTEHSTCTMVFHEVDHYSNLKTGALKWIHIHGQIKHLLEFILLFSMTCIKERSLYVFSCDAQLAIVMVTWLHENRLDLVLSNHLPNLE